MIFGFHISIAGGFRRVVQRAQVKGCQTIQLFSRNPRGWAYSPLDEADVAEFKDQVRRAGISPIFIHLPYLPNLASRHSSFYDRSLRALAEDLQRAEILGARYLIMHMGSRLESSETEAIKTLSESINQALREIKNDVILVLENTAGQGGQIGFRLEKIGAVIGEVEDQTRVGLCIDTAHAFGAGYDISDQRGLDQTLSALDRFVGIKKLLLIHLNDTKAPLGSHKDRHWHIGKGNIGLEGFRNIVNHPLLFHLPGIMETPRKNDLEDIENMSVILGLVED